MKNLLNRLTTAYGQNAMLCQAAADEIKKLRKEIERLTQELANRG